MKGTLRPNYRPLDTRCPINRGHPLNAGRVLWLYGVPHLQSSVWYDLCGRNPAWSLLASPNWVTTPFGSGVTLNGSTQNANGQVPPGITNAYSAAGWARFPAPGGAQTVIGGSQFFLKSASSTANMRALVSFSGGNATAQDPNTYSSGWNRWLLTVAGTTVTLYRNGVAVATATGSGTVSTITVGPAVGFQNSSFTAGTFADISMWNWGLSPAYAAADFELSRLNYPGVLNRVQTTTYFLPSSGSNTVLSASPGTFAETGSPATFGVGLTGGIGSFTETGIPATFGIGLDAHPVAFVLTGYAATFGPSVVSLPRSGWVALDGGRVYRSLGGGRIWRAEDDSMDMLVSNEITLDPNDANVRLYMDFGDIPEIMNGAVVSNCTVAVSPSGPVVTTPANVATAGYQVSTLVSGNGANTGAYTVTFAATLNNADATVITRVAPLNLIT